MKKNLIVKLLNYLNDKTALWGALGGGMIGFGYGFRVGIGIMGIIVFVKVLTDI